MIFNEELIIDGMNFKSKEEVIISLTQRLINKGCVRPEFAQAVLEREKRFPTGLPTKPVGVAIPHADPWFCVETCLSVARLSKPVKFGLMGDETQEIEVNLVLLFGLPDSSKHLQFLSGLAEILQKEDLLTEIIKTPGVSRLKDIIANQLGISGEYR